MDIVLNYSFLKFLHIVSFTTWMAGLFYLPRIYVYHSMEKTESKSYATFTVMEKKIIKIYYESVVYCNVYNRGSFSLRN